MSIFHFLQKKLKASRLRVYLGFLVLGSLILAKSTFCFAQTADHNSYPKSSKQILKSKTSIKKNKKILGQASNDPVKERERKEKQIPPNHFAISLYKPTYILPYYYTGSPANAIYENNTPNNESLKHSEVKYQLSFKVPAWKNILHRPTSLYFAYTQQSYWQVYNHKAFFRETDYEPEFFLATELNYRITKNWHLDFFNLGAVHQSNGFGNALERTWNRIYLEAILSTDNWMLSIKPWYILGNGSMHQDNPDIAQFLGYGRILIAHKYKGHVFSLVAHNFLEGHARSITGELTWSFPLTTYLKGYVQVFSGYGQSLLEYNHRTNSAGLGLALNDWV